MKIAVYPGSFDPITTGHIDVLKRGFKIFDKIIVAIGEQLEKDPTFNLKTRLKLIKDSTNGLNVEIDHFNGLLVDFAKKKSACAILRGLRAVSDFDYEFQTALMNRKLSDIETVFIMTRGKYSYLSSSLVKEVAILGADLSDMVPECVKKELKAKYR